MLNRFTEAAYRIHTDTPTDRNRYADFLRTFAIVAVVVGHWLAARITVIGDDFIRTSTVLVELPQTRWLTWVFQVMPLFFFVGGLVNAISWHAARERGENWADWIRRRARRLLYPLIPLLAFWLLLISVLELGELAPGYLVVIASFSALLPVWFLAAYLGIVALTPVTYRLHRTFGVGVVAALLGTVLIVDLLVNAGLQWIGWANFLVVWTAVHQLGFFWHDGQIPMKPTAGWALAGLSAGVALWLVLMVDYPVSMVTTGEPEPTNDYPPNMALVALAVTQIGVVAALHDPISKWLNRPLPWGATTLTANRLMTVFLWHMTAMVLVAMFIYPSGLWPARNDPDLVWWALRIPWLAMLGLALAVLVGIFGRFEQPNPPEQTDSPHWPMYTRIAAGVILTILGLTLVVTGGIYTGGGLDGVAWVPLGMVALGLWALGVVGR